MATEEIKNNTKRSVTVVGMGIFVAVIFLWSAWSSIRYLQTPVAGAGKIISSHSGDNSAGEEASELPLEELGQKLQKEIEFSASLERVSDSMASNIVFVSEDTKILLYMGSGSYADVLILTQSKNENSAEKDQKALEQYLSDTKNEFEKYNTQEAKKLEDAVLIRSGCRIAVCASTDAAEAKKIITEALK